MWRFRSGRTGSWLLRSTWLCGGQVLVARDSFVAHVFRSKFPYKVGMGGMVEER